MQKPDASLSAAPSQEIGGLLDELQAAFHVLPSFAGKNTRCYDARAAVDKAIASRSSVDAREAERLRAAIVESEDALRVAVENLPPSDARGVVQVVRNTLRAARDPARDHDTGDEAVSETTVTMRYGNPYLACDECGAVENDLTRLGEWHAGCARAGVLRLRGTLADPAPVPPASGLSEERLAEITRRVQRAFETADKLANGLVADSDSGDFGRALADRAHTACKLFAQIAELRALLSRSSEGRTPT